MNLLPKKSWHVGNKDNRARVLRDEEQSRIEAEEKQARKEHAEREQRLNVMRERAHGASSSRVDLFDPKSMRTLETKAKREAEEREAQIEKYTVYLNKKDDKTPWYANGTRSIASERTFTARVEQEWHREDPMRSFSTAATTKSKKEDWNMDAMRREKWERERREGERVAAVLAEAGLNPPHQKQSHRRQRSRSPSQRRH